MRMLRIAVGAVLCAVLGSSCISLDMIAHAEGKPPPTDPNGRPYDPMPGYYALVPLVLPIDLITLPVQFFYFRSDNQGQGYNDDASVPYDDSQAQF